VAALGLKADALSGDLTLEVTAPIVLPALPAAVETAAYRIALEAMTNAVRHSGGRHATVSIDHCGEQLVITVRDDGTGLPANRTPGVGLRSMRERATELGGTLRVTSPADGGTSVEARLPLDAGVSG
jgi:signal transduction histidine kinase